MIKLPKLISDKTEELLNSSIKKEYESAHLYYGMAVWLNKMGFDNAYKLFTLYGDEEIVHAHKLEDYIDNRNSCATIPVVIKPKQEFSECYDILEEAYMHEVAVENNYKLVGVTALKEGDLTTFNFIQWYLSEQKEEIEKLLTLINIYNINESNPNVKEILEKEFKRRLK